MHELGHTTVRNPTSSANDTAEPPPPDRGGPRSSDGRADATVNSNGNGGVDGGSRIHSHNHTQGGGGGEVGKNGTTPVRASRDPETPGNVNNNRNGNAEDQGNESLGEVKPRLTQSSSSGPSKGAAEASAELNANERRPMYSNGSARNADGQQSGSSRDASRRTNATDVRALFDVNRVLPDGV